MLLPSVVSPPILDLKALPSHLKYVYLGEGDTLPVIVASNLSLSHQEKLVQVLRDQKTAIGWTLADIKGMSPLHASHSLGGRSSTISRSAT